MVSGWLPIEARSSFKLIQAKHPDKLMQDLVVEAMNDLFAKYNVCILYRSYAADE